MASTSKAPSVLEKFFNVKSGISYVVQEGKNTHQRYDYTKLRDIQAKMNPLLAENRLIIKTQISGRPIPEGGTTVDQYDISVDFICVDSGEILSYEFLNIPGDTAQKNAVQSFGSTTTYLTRYALGTIFQIPYYTPKEEPDEVDMDTIQPHRTAGPAATKAATPKATPPAKAAAKTSSYGSEVWQEAQNLGLSQDDVLSVLGSHGLTTLKEVTQDNYKSIRKTLQDYAIDAAEKTHEN